MKNHGCSRFPNGSWEIWVSKVTIPPRCVQAYPGVCVPRRQQPALRLWDLRELHDALRERGDAVLQVLEGLLVNLRKAVHSTPYCVILCNTSRKATPLHIISRKVSVAPETSRNRRFFNSFGPARCPKSLFLSLICYSEIYSNGEWRDVLWSGV